MQPQLVGDTLSSSWLENFFPSEAVMEEAKRYTEQVPGKDPYLETSFSPIAVRRDPYTLYSTDEEGELRYKLSISTVLLENLLHIRDDILSTSPFHLNGYAKIGLTALLGVVTIPLVGCTAIIETIARLGLALLCSPLLLLSCFTESEEGDSCPIWLAKSGLYNIAVIPSGIVAAYSMFVTPQNFENAEDITTLLNEASCNMEEVVMDRWIKI